MSPWPVCYWLFLHRRFLPSFLQEKKARSFVRRFLFDSFALAFGVIEGGADGSGQGTGRWELSVSLVEGDLHAAWPEACDERQPPLGKTGQKGSRLA